MILIFRFFLIYLYLFIFAQFNNNSNKKNCPTHGLNPTQSDPCGLGWVGLDLCHGLGWIKFFLIHYGGLDKKISLTLPNPTYAHP